MTPALKRSVIVALLAMLASVGAAAQQREVTSAPMPEPVVKQLTTDGQTLVEDRYFHCAGTPGRSTKQLFRLPVLDKGELLAMATIHMNRVLSDERWQPTASIGFNEEGRKSAIRLQMHFESNRPEELHFTLSKEGEQGIEHQFLISLPRNSRGLPVVLKWLPEGSAVAVVGGKSAKVADLAFKPNILELACSTGDFEFESVALLSE